MKLVLIGDLHFPAIDQGVSGIAEARQSFFQHFLDKFLEQEGDYHISLGDLTHYGLQEELESVYHLLRRNQRNFVHVLGNHDLYAQRRQDVLKQTGQLRYHSITTDLGVLAFIDTAKEMNYEDWGGWVDEEQLAWLEQVVQDSGTKPLFLFAHHPVYQTTKRSEVEKGSIHPSIDMWRILKQKQGLGVYFNGHTHIDSIVKQHNWTFVQLAACLDVPAIRLIDVSENDINIAAMDFNDSALFEHGRTVSGQMNHFTPQANVKGQSDERECRISLSRAMNLLNG